jgi:hypothetical protein
MDDKSVLAHIHELVDEEKVLRSSKHQHTSVERRRLEAIQLELDQYWDLLRQRRAREEFGEDPDQAHERTVNEVEGYLQ